MLILGRKEGTSFTVGDALVSIYKIEGKYVKVAVSAPKSIPVHRVDKLLDYENQKFFKFEE